MRPPELPGLPRDGAGEPVFPGAWQARAFALAALLHERGAFAWPDFAAALAAEIDRAPDGDYYAGWLRALERLLAERGIAAPGAVAALAEAWERAAAATPHGAPIRLENAPGRQEDPATPGPRGLRPAGGATPRRQRCGRDRPPARP